MFQPPCSTLGTKPSRWEIKPRCHRKERDPFVPSTFKLVSSLSFSHSSEFGQWVAHFLVDFLHWAQCLEYRHPPLMMDSYPNKIFKSTISWLALNPLHLQNILAKQHNVQCSVLLSSWSLAAIRKPPAMKIKIQHFWNSFWICNCLYTTVKWYSHKSNHIKWGQSVGISQHAWEVASEPTQCWVLLRKQVQILLMAKPLLPIAFA